mmetsp:Transcript_14726/g.22310  ORF Transcript_14726/g.22310 Transcript_14726/m.22310 type:complete len:225 (-) Transcript_14726:613-1287(-)
MDIAYTSTNPLDDSSLLSSSYGYSLALRLRPPLIGFNTTRDTPVIIFCRAEELFSIVSISTLSVSLLLLLSSPISSSSWFLYSFIKTSNSFNTKCESLPQAQNSHWLTIPPTVQWNKPKLKLKLTPTSETKLLLLRLLLLIVVPMNTASTPSGLAPLRIVNECWTSPHNRAICVTCTDGTNAAVVAVAALFLVHVFASSLVLVLVLVPIPLVEDDESTPSVQAS